MNRSRFHVAAAALAAGVLAAGGGAALVAVEHDGPATAAASATTTAAASSSLAAVTSSTASTGLTVAQIAAKDSPGVVELEVTTASSDPFGRGSTSSAVGTGFVVDTDGHVVTNAHVIDGAQSITVRFSDGATYDATVVGSDLSTDVAVVQVDAPAAQLHPLSFGDSSAVEVGDAVVAIGSPYGLDTSVSTGIVSAVDREITAPDESSTISGAIQTDAAINHGNSGGPLLDANGKVIGITAQIESESGGNDGVGFAVPSNTVRSVVAQLLADGTAQPAVLGVQAQTLPSAVAAELGEASGVALTQVQSGSGAAAAGLHASSGSRTVGAASYPTGGDVLTALDGRRLASLQELRALIAAEQPGAKVRLTVAGNGSSRVVTATLGAAA